MKKLIHSLSLGSRRETAFYWVLAASILLAIIGLITNAELYGLATVIAAIWAGFYGYALNETRRPSSTSYTGYTTPPNDK